MPLRFHWMLPKGGEMSMRSVQATSRVLTTERSSPCAQPDMEGWLRFASHAEEVGIESVLLSFSRYEPDTLMIACALGRATRKLKFIAAYRSGLMQPTTFVQQLNTLSGLIQGRVAVNVVAGSSPAEQRGYGDFLDHDDRYARAEEFLAICNAFWSGPGRGRFRGEVLPRRARPPAYRLHRPGPRRARDLRLRPFPAGRTPGAVPRLVLAPPDRYPRGARPPGGADPRTGRRALPAAGAHLPADPGGGDPRRPCDAAR